MASCCRFLNNCPANCCVSLRETRLGPRLAGRGLEDLGGWGAGGFWGVRVLPRAPPLSAFAGGNDAGMGTVGGKSGESTFLRACFPARLARQDAGMKKRTTPVNIILTELPTNCFGNCPPGPLQSCKLWRWWALATSSTPHALNIEEATAASAQEKSTHLSR